MAAKTIMEVIRSRAIMVKERSLFFFLIGEGNLDFK